MISFSHRIIFKLVFATAFLVSVLSWNCYASNMDYTGGTEVKKKIGLSSIGSLGSGGNNVGYSQSLNESAKKEIIAALNRDQLAGLFQGLDDSGKQDMFSLLSSDQKKELFTGLSDPEKQRMFRALDDEEKNELFSSIDRADKEIILSNLTYIEKSRLINSLSDSEKSDWLEKYPELVSDIDFTDKDFSVEKGNGFSRLENIFSGNVSTGIDRELKQFGYDFFSPKSAFSPAQNVPVGPEYTIGPSDSFTVHLWGKVEETHSVTVSRDGRINLRRLGTLNVGGLTFSELKVFLNNKFKEYYPDFNMSITMDALKSVDVFMVGEFNKPGTYNLSSLSTVVSALFASGGPSKNGSLRNINVLSNGTHIKTIDLYDFFINGSKGDDVTLKQGYTIFVPVIGPTAAISGHVKRPAIYEMKGDQTLEDIINLAGGVLPTGHLQNVVVERIAGHKRRVIASFDLDSKNAQTESNLKTVIRDGDLIKIYPVHKNIEKIIYLEGNVKYPNEYELKTGMRIKDIIPDYDHLLPETYLKQAEIIRLVPPDLHPEIRMFDLGAMLEGDESQNILLKDRDRIKVYNAWEKQNVPEVSISGALRNPGVFRLYKGMTIKDLIFAAGNTAKDAYLEEGELSRVASGTSGSDIIKIQFSPKSAIAGDPEHNLTLRADDLIHIREQPKYKSSLERRVYLEGEFKFPGEYSFSEGEKISSVIKRAGGLTEEAYPYGAVFTRESAKEIWAERKKEYIDKLEQDIVTVSAFSAETSLDASQASIAMQTLNAKKEMLEKMKATEPTGRMLINISDLILMPSSENDLELRPNDKIIVGRRPDSVFIIGEVYNPSALICKEEADVSYYLNLVGGMTKNADKSEIHIVRADGHVESRQQSKFGLFNWDSKNHRWGFGSFKSVELNPGDTIIVPKKIVRFGFMKFLKDTTSIMYQIAVSAGVLNDILDDK